MSRRLSFKRLMNRMESKEQFDEYCKNFAEEYAKTPNEIARKYFCYNYNMSQNCYYRILEYAVVNNLVEDHIVARMLNKSVNNQYRFNESSGATSMAKYTRLYLERCKNMAKSLSEEEVKDIAEEFANEYRKSKYRLALKHNLTTTSMDYVLARAIEENIVDDDTVNAIRRHLLKGLKNEKEIDMRKSINLMVETRIANQMN